jgi:hypothetical protein
MIRIMKLGLNQVPTLHDVFSFLCYQSMEYIYGSKRKEIGLISPLEAFTQKTSSSKLF